MRFGSTTRYQKPRNSLDSKLFWTNRLRKKQRPFHQPKKSWRPYYSDLLNWFDAVLKKKRTIFFPEEKILFHYDNASDHSSCIVVPKWNERYELLSRPPYSPDLGPSDFFAFPKLKKSLAGKRFASNEEVIVTTNCYIAGLETFYFGRL